MWFKKALPDNLSKLEKDRLLAYVGYSHSDMNLVGEYENAVDILVNKIIEDKIRADLIAHPLLYLMRHTVELALKENIKYLNKYSGLGLEKIVTHSIDKLFDEFERHYNKLATDLNFKEELDVEYNKYSNDLKELIKKLGTDWSSFRYVYSISGHKVFNDSEILNIYDLKKKFDNTSIFLTVTADAISPFTDFVDYIKVDNSIVTKSFGRVLHCFAEFQKEWLIENMNEKYEKIIEGKIWADDEAN
jgi:hypothetical protein